MNVRKYLGQRNGGS